MVRYPLKSNIMNRNATAELAAFYYDHLKATDLIKWLADANTLLRQYGMNNEPGYHAANQLVYRMGSFFLPKVVAAPQHDEIDEMLSRELPQLFNNNFSDMLIRELALIFGHRHYSEARKGLAYIMNKFMADYARFSNNPYFLSRFLHAHSSLIILGEKYHQYELDTIAAQPAPLPQQQIAQ